MDIRRADEALAASESRLRGSTFDEVDLAASRFSKVKMDRTMMSEVDLTGLSLTRCDLRGASISSCRTDGMTIDGIPLRDLLASYAPARSSQTSARRPGLPRRRRKLIGVAATLAFVVVYALVAMALAQIRFQPGPPSLWQWLFYAIVGMGWIVPLMPLIRWMERPDEGSR